MESLPKITITTGTAGKADTRHGDSGSSAGGQSFADLLSIAHAAGATKPATQTADRGTTDSSAPTSDASGASAVTATVTAADRGTQTNTGAVDNSGKNGKIARNTTVGTTDNTDKNTADKSGTASQGSTPGNFAIGLAGAMLNTLAPSAPSAPAATATTPITDAIIGAVGAGATPQNGAQAQTSAQPQSGAQGQGAAATQAAAASPTGAGQAQADAGAAAAKAGAATDALAKGPDLKTAADHLRAAIAAVTGNTSNTGAATATTAATAKAAGGSTQPTTTATVAAPTAPAGATGTPAPGANLVLTTDGAPADPAAAATAADAAGGGKSTPGKANSLVTGSSDVVTAKAAIRTNALDPTATVKDAKTTAGAATGASTPATPTPATADANAARTAAGPSPAAVNNAAQSGSDSAAARAQHAADVAKADAATTTDAPAATASGASSGTADASTTAAAIGGTDSSAATHHTAASGAARAVPVPAPVFDQIALSVNRAAGDGLDHITIQLKPESLGRVDVHLQLGQDGRMSATFVADRQDTLDMLQRDSRGLERALHDAGLRTDSGGLQFNLRSGGQDHAGLARDMAQASQNNNAGTATPADTGDSTSTTARLGRVIKGLLDISV